MTKLLFPFFILLISYHFLFSQEIDNNLVLYDSVTDANCEYLLNRLDGFVYELSQNPNAKGYVVLDGGTNAIENNFHKTFFMKYIKMRGFKNEPYSIITTKGGNNLKIDFWLSKEGMKPSIREEEFGYLLLEPKSEYFFAEESGEIERFDGELTFVGDCPACCIETVELNLLAKILDANPKLNAVMTISNRTNRRQYNRFANYFLNEAKRTYKIPANRLKIIYGGNKDIGYTWNKNMASVSVILVTKP